MQEALSMEYYGDSLEEISKLLRLYFIRTRLFFRDKLDRFYELYYFSKKPTPITPSINSGKLTLNNILNSSDRDKHPTGSFVAGSSKDRIKEKNVLSDKDFDGQVKTKNVQQADLEDLIKKEIKLKITSEAFEKANYVSRRITELAGEKLELYFYLTNFHEKQEKGDIAVRDIFIAHKQKVYPNLVEPHDTVTSQNIIINSLDQDIIGWGHSHGNHSNFHSDIDNESTNGTLAMHGIEYQFDFENNQDMPHLSEGRAKIYYTFSIVFNTRNEKPYCVLAYSLERFKSGKLIKEVPFEIIEEKNNIPFEKADIDKQLLEKVIVRGEESLLDLYSKKTGRSTEDILSNAGSLEPVESYVGKKDEGQKKRDEEKDQRIALMLTTSELRKAKKQLEEYQSTHSHTDPEYEALSAQNQELSSQNLELMGKVSSLEKRLSSAQSEIKQKQKGATLIKREMPSVEDVEKEAVNKYKKSEQYGKDIEVLVEERLSSSKKKIEESLSKTYEKQITDLKKSEGSLKQENEGLVSKVLELSEENKALKDEKNRSNEVFKDYKSEYNQKSFDDLQKRYDKLEQENKKLKGEKTPSIYKKIIKGRVLPWALVGSLFLTSLGSMFLFYRNNQKLPQEPIKQTYKIQQTVQGLQDRYSGIEEKLNQTDSKIQSLSKTIEEVREQYRKQNEELENVNKNYAGLNTQYSAVLEENKGLEDKIANLENKNEEFNKKIIDLNDKYKNQANELESIKSSNLELEKNYGEQKNRLNTLKESQKNLETKYDQQTKEIDSLKKSNKKLETDYEKQSPEIINLKKDYSDLKTKYDSLKGTKEQEHKADKTGLQDSTKVFSYELNGQLESIARNRGLWGLAEHFGIQGHKNITGFIKDVSQLNSLAYNDTNGDGIGPDLWKKSDLDNGMFKISKGIAEKYNLNLSNI